MPNRLADESSPYLLAAREQSGGLASLGTRGASERGERRPADLFVDRLFGLPLVPRDGAREFRESSRSPAAHERAFVCIKVDREERPDLDQIYMNAVQMMTGPRRLADVGLSDARPAAVLWRHVLAAVSHGMGMPGFDQVLLAVPKLGSIGAPASARPGQRL